MHLSSQQYYTHQLVQMAAKAQIKPESAVENYSDDNEDCKEVKYILSGVKSVKNMHELKKNNLTQTRTANPFDRILKQDKIDKLEKQKAQLLYSLEILKNGAVSAIVQKQEIIDKLRKLFTDSHTFQGLEKDDSKMQELENLLQYIKDLQEQRNYLKDDVEKERRRFQMEIYERQQIIQELTNELNWSTQRIESLEKYDKLLEQKIKVMQESNDNLSVLLNQSQQNLKHERKRKTEESELLNNKSSESIHHCSDSENSSTWNPRSMRKIVHSADSNPDLRLSMSRSLDESVIQSRIQQMQNQHTIEIQDLTDFYESRIESLKKLCQQYPQLPFTMETMSSKKDNENRIGEVAQNHSNYSGFTNEVEAERNSQLKKNLSLGSFKSGMKMEPIDEREEMQSPRRTLRKQLSGYKNNSRSNFDMHKNSSDKSISKQSYSSNQDVEKESQFSYKYFEYPSSSFKKNRSSQMSEAKSDFSSPLKLPDSQKEQQSGDNISQIRKPDERKSKVTEQLWQKLFWFASGTITGGLLLKFGNKLFK